MVRAQPREVLAVNRRTALVADTLRRLEEEQTNFEAFLARLREAKDKAEFDQFMDDRAKRSEGPTEASA